MIKLIVAFRNFSDAPKILFLNTSKFCVCNSENAIVAVPKIYKNIDI
jgi:hypothetical protein